MKKTMLTFIMILFLCGTVSATVSWIPGQSPPNFSRSPANPTTNDVITITIPTSVYNNSQVAQQALGGTPTLDIDSANRTVVLSFEPPAPTTPAGSTAC